MNQTAMEIVKDEPITPMSVLQIAVQQGKDVGELSKLLELQERFEAMEARKAFYAAMKRFKDNPPEISKNGVGHNKAKYATLDHACDQIIPALAKVGITHKWKTSVKDGKITVACLLSHELGYSDPDPPMIEAAADTSGSKNPIQAIGSTIKYLERYTLFAATGLDDGSKDDDGAGGDGTDKEALAAQVALIEKCADSVELQRVFTIAYKWADDAGDKNASGQIIRARDKRKQELKSAPQPAPQGGNRIAEPLTVERLEWIKGANDMDELKRIYSNALKMAKQAGDDVFADQLTKAANKRAEAIRANV